MPGLLFNQHQVLLTLVFTITDYKCQGSTIDSLVLDLRFYTQRGVDQHKKLTSLKPFLGNTICNNLNHNLISRLSLLRAPHN